MKNLKHITFTGIGTDTDFKALREIQNEFPHIEWGVLMSRNWEKNGPRYFNPDRLYDLKFMELNLNLSCHVCGSVAREALKNNWEPMKQLTHYHYDIFQRCQLNIGSTDPTPKTPFLRKPLFLKELIIQQKSENDLLAFDTIIDRSNMSVLLDASGGRGIDTPFKPFHRLGLKVGYAGGLTPNNVGDKLYHLLREVDGDFWIDMESGVRTDEQFDLLKVNKVLCICKEVMREFNRVGAPTKAHMRTSY